MKQDFVFVYSLLQGHLIKVTKTWNEILTIRRGSKQEQPEKGPAKQLPLKRL